jgi:hypothetical protein
VATSIRSRLLLVPLLALAPALGAEEVDVITLKSGAVLIGVYDKAASTLSLRGGALGTAVIDPVEIASLARRELGDPAPATAASVPPAGTAAAPAAPAPAPTESGEVAALRRTVADEQRKLDELTTWNDAVQDSLVKAKDKATDAANARQQAADKLELEKAMNGATTRESEQKLEQATANATKTAVALPALEAEGRAAQAKLDLARKNLTRDQQRLEAALRK